MRSKINENETATIPLAPYYTPLVVAQILADWAIFEKDTTVLDPSFGGCAFLVSAQERLLRLGTDKPSQHIYGVDIDPATLNSTVPLIASGASPEQFIISDFFNLRPQDFRCGLFDAILGNPPYVRYHNIPRHAHAQAEERLESYDIHLSGRSSYWAFFLLYAMQFLRTGGRLAMVLPGAFLHTDYSSNVRASLVKAFEHVTVVLLKERIFDQTEEESVLVLASGAKLPNKSLRIGKAESVDDLRSVICDPITNTRLFVEEMQHGGDWIRALVEPEILELYDALTAKPDVIQLGDWVTARIGVVTGNNEFFILSGSEQKEKGIDDKYVLPVVRKPSWFKGVWITDEELTIYRNNGTRSRLLALTEKESRLPKTIRDYLQIGNKKGVQNAQKCKSRKLWYAVPQTFIPPAFIQCMSAGWPRVIVNKSSYTCTNNILRLSWKNHEEHLPKDWARLALGTLSTISQLSAELVGRSYGGGVLKLEPTELGSLVVPLVDPKKSDGVALQVDALLRSGNFTEATRVVDSVLIEDGLGLTEDNLHQIRAARDLLLERRRNHRGDVSRILGA